MRIKKVIQQQRWVQLCFVLLFAGIGTLLLFTSFAATPYLSIEAENGTRLGTITEGIDLNPSGKYIQFNAAPSVPTGTKCVVDLHGAGMPADGGPMDSATTKYSVKGPLGNRINYGTYGWRYNYSPGGNAEYDDIDGSGYISAKAIITNAMTGCGQVIIHGWSNGGGLAAALYCRSETFGGKVIGYVVDDPEYNGMTQNCQSPASIKVQGYRTGALPNDWFIEAMGITPVQSIKTDHDWWPNPPEFDTWW